MSILLAALATAAITLDPASIEHRKCIKDATFRLERSGDSASDVAKAVELSCRKELIASMAPGTNLGRAQDREIFELFVESFRDMALENIIKIRACRKTPGCLVNSVTAFGAGLDQSNH